MKKISFFFLISLFVSPLYADVTPTTRTITFKNQCSFKVWLAFTPSFIPGNNASCTTDSDCLRGAPCIASQCVYPVPTPQGGSSDSFWGLDPYNSASPNNPANQSVVTVTLQSSIPDPKNPSNIVYQYVANFGARTGCQAVKDANNQMQLQCDTGQCTTDANGGCISGMNNPANHAEITMNQASVDYYDMSFVNGVNVPIGIAPDTTPAAADPYGQNPLFWCGKSGFKDARGDYYKAQSDSKNLIGCNWLFTPPPTPAYSGFDSSVFYTVVDYTGTVQCQSDDKCAAGERCGFSVNDLANNPQAIPLCGTPIAYTIPANTCGSPYNQGAALPKQAFGCYSEPGALDAFKMQAFAMCAVPPNAPSGVNAPPTCYVDSSSTPDPECCGCIAWEKTLPLDANATCRVGDAAGTTANFWQTNIRDKVSWLAENCLAGYSYQYDDVHSTFVCTSTQQPSDTNPNSMNYVVTFCPDGQTLFGPN